MARQQKTTKRQKQKTILRFPDLEHSKNAVVNSLAATSSQESYSHAIDEFIGWYCSEPRLAFNRTAVLRYRFFLEQKNLAPSTINVRLAAVRRLAYEASDSGLLSPELAAGIRMKGALISTPGWLRRNLPDRDFIRRWIAIQTRHISAERLPDRVHTRKIGVHKSIVHYHPQDKRVGDSRRQYTRDRTGGTYPNLLETRRPVTKL